MSAPASTRRLGALAIVMGVASAVVASYAVHGSMPFNAVHLPGERALETTTWAPEGWKFFTRDPQEETVVAYVQRGESWDRAFASGSSPKYLFGLDRHGRAEGAELAALATELANTAFRKCDDEPTACLDRSRSSTPVVNTSPQPTLCGAVAIVMQRPVPWAWATSGRPVTMPSRIARLEVSC